MLIIDDLPTFERPMKANSGCAQSGQPANPLALVMKVADLIFMERRIGNGGPAGQSRISMDFEAPAFDLAREATKGFPRRRPTSDMVKPRLSYLIQLLAALALSSCVPPKAVVVQEEPKKDQPVPEVATTEPNLPPPVDDEFRLPDFTTMPRDEEFKASLPMATPANQMPGSINVRPPTEPPSRPKPKTEE
jgi:hypothetical protein